MKNKKVSAWLSLVLLSGLLTAPWAQALDRDTEIDILTTRLVSLLKAEKSNEALPLFEQLEKMNAKLPESFDYHYVETLDKVGKVVKAVVRGEAYLKKYGKRGKNYGQVVEIVARRRPEVELARLDAEFGMVRIPGRNYAMDRTEVTQKQWRAVMGGDPPELYSEHKGCDDCAVTDVSWHDAKEFIAKLNARTQGGYRLPTEAEWEYACRAGATQEYCGSDSVEAVAWYDGNSGGKVHPVAQKQANAWGLYDLSGNAWEWTEDCYEGDCGRRVVRGGSWSNAAYFARAAYRSFFDAGNRFINHGFRLARTLP